MNKVLIETKRLLIRNFRKADAAGVFELWSKPLVNCYVSEKMETIEQAYEYMEEANDEYDFAVCLKESNEFIGVLFGEFEEPDTFSPCWNFIPSYFGKGYATEAVTAYFDYLFKEKNMRRLYAFTEDDNIASQKVCKKLGMREEGLFKEFISFVNNSDGTPKYENTYQFALLKWEWENH